MNNKAGTMAGSNLGMSHAATMWFERRGINVETAARLKVYTGKRVQNGDDTWEVVPDLNGTILCFPFIDRGVEVGCKYRAKDREGNRTFWQKAGGSKTFFNCDVIDDAALHDGRQPLVITEGEPDCMVGIDAGHHWTVSVPDGAPADKDKNGNVIPMRPEEDIDPKDDPKFEFIFKNWDRLQKVKRFILATDNDGPGQRLKEELARRLGRVRCAFVVYPKDEVVPDDGKMRCCKDFNEVSQYFGSDAVAEMINTAKPYPVSGLYTIDDFEEVKREVFDVGFPMLEKHVKLWRGAFVVTSGLPGSGKSALWDQIAYNMARRHSWRVAFATFEEDVRPDLLNKLRHFYIKRPRRVWSASTIVQADAWIRDHFVFICRDPSGSVDSQCTVAWVIDRLEDAVLRYGIDMAVLDPWNELDHKRANGQQRDEYLNDSVRDIKDFGHRRRVCTVIIAHPTKSAAGSVKDGNPMSLYDISDGAAWANKAELGIIVHRGSHADTLTDVYVRKVKFRGTGLVDSANVVYDTDLEMFVNEREDDKWKDDGAAFI